MSFATYRVCIVKITRHVYRQESLHEEQRLQAYLLAHGMDLSAPITWRHDPESLCCRYQQVSPTNEDTINSLSPPRCACGATTDLIPGTQPPMCSACAAVFRDVW